jgi:Flp pilus assembly protein TadG
MRPQWNAHRSERGAIFVQVGVAIFVLMAFNVFVIDFGMLWVARRQAQNAADAGALAGIVGMAYDRYVTSQTPANVHASAQAIATLAANKVWEPGATAAVTATCPAGVTGTCVQVNVYKNGDNGSTTLPALFGPILGVTSQSVQASATGVIGRANTTTCLKPWALPDKWQADSVAPASEFKAYAGGVHLATHDVYTPPDGSQATSRTVPTDYGWIVRFDVNLMNDPLTDPIRRGHVLEAPALTLPLDLPGPAAHLDNMRSCNGQAVSIGDRLPLDLTMTGGGSGTAEAAAQEQFDRDPSADWAFEAGGYVVNSCAPGCTPFASLSPRLWAVALYDPDDFDKQRTSIPPWPDCLGGSPCVRVANIVGFFIDHMDPSLPNGRHGHLVRHPGVTVTGPPTIIEDGSWLVEPRLIR